MSSTVIRQRWLQNLSAKEWRLKSAALTECGASRAHNQDHVLADDLAGIFVAADGVGGRDGGAEASELLCAVVAGELLETETVGNFRLSDAKAAFDRAVATATNGMKELGHVCPAMSSMATTLVSAWYVNDNVYYAHAGDSRLYLLRGKRLQRLTVDDSLVEALCQAGVVSETDRQTNVWRHVITRYIGPSSNDCRLHVDQLQVRNGDRLILTTDGITDTLYDDALAGAANSAFPFNTPEELCRWLVHAAKEAGAQDDTSCVVVDFSH